MKDILGQIFLTHMKNLVCVIISGGQTALRHCTKTLMLRFLGRHKCDKCQMLSYGTAHYVLPSHTTFSDLDHIPLVLLSH